MSEQESVVDSAATEREWQEGVVDSTVAATERRWREALERALGLEADPEHTVGWFEETVFKIREIGNQDPRPRIEKAIEEAFADADGTSPRRLPPRFKLETMRHGLTQEFHFYPEEGKNEVERALAGRTVAVLEKLAAIIEFDHIDDRPDELREEQDKLLSFARSVLERKEEGLVLFITTGEWPDGRLGEVFVRAGKPGTKSRGYLDAICTIMSIGLQYGIPLATFVTKFDSTRFPPDGFVTGHTEPALKRCKSPLDLLVRWLAFAYDPDTGVRRMR